MTAKEALELLKSRIDISYYIKADELKLIEKACEEPVKKVIKKN